MQTVTLNSIDELPDLYNSILEDFNGIDYADHLAKELDVIADENKRMFDSSTGPDGQAWKPNAPSTIAQKGHSTILRGIKGQRPKNFKATKRRPAAKFSRAKNIAGHRLATSLTAKTRQSFGDAVREAIQEEDGKAYLTFGTSVEYSIYNDRGTSRIPARPHIGITEKLLDEMTVRVTDFALAELAK